MIDAAGRGRVTREPEDQDKHDRDKHDQVKADREPRGSAADGVPRMQANRAERNPNAPTKSER